MFILPYFVRESISPSGYKIHTISLFLDKGGSQLLSIENYTPKEFCEENGLVVKKI